MTLVNMSQRSATLFQLALAFIFLLKVDKSIFLAKLFASLFISFPLNFAAELS